MKEDNLLLKARGGDDFSLDRLMLMYTPLVNKIARKYFLVGAGLDDLIQEGMIGLYKAFLGYKEEALSSFKTFATLCITRQIQSAVKLANRNKNIPLNAYFSINNQGMVVTSTPINADSSEEGIYIPSGDLSPEEYIINEERVAEINRNIEKSLSDFEKKVLQHFISGKNYIEIAQILAKEPKSIDNALNRIKIKLRFLKY